jgi:hypothetical protein
MCGFGDFQFHSSLGFTPSIVESNAKTGDWESSLSIECTFFVWEMASVALNFIKITFAKGINFPDKDEKVLRLNNIEPPHFNP